MHCLLFLLYEIAFLRAGFDMPSKSTRATQPAVIEYKSKTTSAPHYSPRQINIEGQD